MRKLIKYVRQFWGSVLCILLLLVLEAACDLSLPKYTSDIVDVGIQQGGIKESIPKQMRPQTFERICFLLSKQEKQMMKEAYRFSKTKQIYILKEMEKKTIQPIEKQIDQAWLMVSLLSGQSEYAKQVQNIFMQQMPAIKEGTDHFAVLQQLPKQQRQQFFATLTKKWENIPETIQKQMITHQIKQEYEATGLSLKTIQSHYILWAGCKMLVLAFVAMAATIIVGLLAARVAAGVGKNLRSAVFEKVLSFSNAEMDHFSTSTLITRSTNDIQQVQLLLVMLLRLVFYAPILGMGGLIRAWHTNVSMVWIIAVSLLAVLLVVMILFTFTMPKFKKMQHLIDRLNLVMREILTGLPVIRAFGTQKQEEKRFDQANRNLTRTSLFVNRTMALMMPCMMLIMNATTILIVWNGAKGIDLGEMQVGSMMAFIQYTMQIIMAFLMISMMTIMIPRASVSADRIAEVLEMPLSIIETKETKAFLQEKKGYVSFENVSFRYPNAKEDALENITFTAKPGETTAIIGSTGSGKTTLINLIPRLFDATKGRIMVDGVDVKEVSLADLRDRIGFVPQKGVLFSGTIASNLKYGSEQKEGVDIEKAANIAQATEFIEEKEQKFDAAITQGGKNVSGGQKQRLAIARAIAKNPEIYIFDDSFSALDYRTDAALRHALQEQCGNQTVLIVAQRISTILHADQIIVLEEGKIVGIGTHQQLLKQCEVYEQIARSQLSKEELEHE